MAEPQTPASTPAAVVADSDDSIIGDILGKPKESLGDPEGGDEAPADDAEAESDGDHTEADSTDEAEEPADDIEDDDPDQDDAGLAAARKAAADGDIEKAFKLAFGKHADKMLSANKLFSGVRAAKAKAVREVQAREAQVAQQSQQGQHWVAQQRQQISTIIDQLRPYEEIHQARVAFQQSGDPELLKAIVEKTSGMSYDDAQKAILTKMRRSPGERALQQQVQTLMQKLEDTERKKAEESQQLTAQQQYTADLGHITGQLKGEVTKVPRFAERVYKVLVDTKGPLGLTLTVEEAGRRVLNAERRKLATHPLAAKPPAKPNASQAAAILAKSKKRPAPALRRDSQSNGAADPSSESTDDILADILKSKNRVRA